MNSNAKSESVSHSVLSDLGFPCSSVGKESACSAGDLGSITGLGRSHGEGNGSPLQYCCLKNLMDIGLEGCSPWGCKELGTTERLNLLTCVRLFATPWTVAHQAPLSMKFSTQEYWTGLSFSSPGDLPDPGLLHCRQILYGLSHPVMLKFKPESREPLSSPPTYLFSASPTPLLVEKEGWYPVILTAKQKEDGT